MTATQFTSTATDANGRTHRLSLKTEPLESGNLRVSAIKRVARTDVHLGRFLFERDRNGNTISVRPVTQPSTRLAQFPAAWMLGVLGLIPTQQAVAEMLMNKEHEVLNPPESSDSTIHPNPPSDAPSQVAGSEQDEITQMIQRDSIINQEREEEEFMRLQEETGLDSWEEINQFLAEMESRNTSAEEPKWLKNFGDDMEAANGSPGDPNARDFLL